MDILEYTAYIRGLINESAASVAMHEAVRNGAALLRAEIQNRIGNQGTDSSGVKLRAYSTTPMYVTKKMFIQPSAFSPQKGRTTMYLKNGYKELREIQGRRTDITNLHYSLAMFKDFQVGFDTEAAYIGFTDDEQIEKRKALEGEDFYNTPIFTATSGEMANYIKYVTDYYLKIIYK